MSAQVPLVNSIQRIRSRSIETISEAERARDEKLMEAEKEKEKYEESNNSNQMMALMNSYGPKSEAEAAADMMKLTETFGEMKFASGQLNLHTATIEEKSVSESSNSSSLPVSSPSTLLLGRQMSLNFSSEILSSIDFPLLFSEIWTNFLDSALVDKFEPVDGELIEPALNALVALCVFQPDPLISTLYNRFDSSSNLFSRLSLSRSSEKLRQLFALAISELVSHSSQLVSPISVRSPLEYFLSLSLNSLPSGSSESSECEEYFCLLISLLRQANSAQPPIPAELFSSASFFAVLQSKLSSHSTSEPLKGTSIDKLLCGFLSVLIELIRISPSLRVVSTSTELIDLLFFQCLFSDSPKCRSTQSRQLALELILELVKSDEKTDSPGVRANFLHLLHLFRVHRAKSSKLTVWDYSPEKQSIAGSGYVGLRNLGA